MEPTPEHVKIDAIKLNLNGLVVELKPEQAKALWQQLDELFGPRPAAPVWITPTYPYLWWVNPNSEPFPDRWVVTCDAYAGNKLEINT